VAESAAEEQETRCVVCYFFWVGGRLVVVAVVVAVVGGVVGSVWAGERGWVPSRGPGQGQGVVTSLAVDPQRPRIVYAGVTGAALTWDQGKGVFKSTDGGRTWRAVNRGLTGTNEPVGSTLAVFSLAIDPRHPRIVYAATEEFGLYKSTDGGAHWRLSSRIGWSPIVIDPQRPTTVYAGGGSPLLKSTNAGATWTSSGSGLGQRSVGALAIDPRNPRTLYAGMQGLGVAGYRGGVFKSTDGGRSWRRVGVKSYSVNAIAIDPRSPQTVYAGLGWPTNPGQADSPSDGAVLKTIDGGRSWQTLALTEGVTALAIDPGNPDVLYAGTADHGVFESSDAGGSWSPKNTGLANQRIWNLAISADGQTLYAGTNNGVFVSHR
jgi:photosystem II stability/assembly factor-like uncharacterized protein